MPVPRATWSIVLLLALTACGDSTATPSDTPLPAADPVSSASLPPLIVPTVPPATAAPTAPPAAEGFTRHTIAAQAFSIELPSDWEVIDLTDEDFELVIEELSSERPDQAALWQQAIGAAQQGMALMAIDYGSASSGFADNVNVIVVPGETSFNEALSERASYIEEAFGTTVTIGQETLPAGEAGTLSYTADIGEVRSSGMQYYLDGDGRSYIITFSYNATAPQPAAMATAIRSFRIEE